ncbi:PREDICTED: serine/threonine-protein phosphatase 7 long form homolog [Lupinus angustifolius]|uniref:serine/threonine-protein phosphatase 7 long form homolog n=1 Tax=Lupinus angustifolius TaxID=3871 RepID=UPI00092FD44C|nr:PREDICTED: serine/threonine-protein phosphatase 7 long form homolog [Lupinus angustifolius]
MGQRIQMSWLDSTFAVLPPHADDAVIERQARAFILRMIGGYLMPDTSGSRVHLMYLPLLEDFSQTFQYSWGSAVLACLYRGICRAALISYQIEIGGCLHLLQSWSWAYDRIPMLAPRVHNNDSQTFPLVQRWAQHLITTNIPGHATNIIRSMLDRLRIERFGWTPYRNITYVGPIPDVVRARVSLICFALVEWHATNRVMRQFGLLQPIPEDPINLEKQYKMDLRGKNDYNWPQKYD